MLYADKTQRYVIPPIKEGNNYCRKKILEDVGVKDKMCVFPVNNQKFMKKQFLAALISLTAVTAANAQMPYSVSVQDQAYTSLTGATNINGNTIWDEENYIVPLGFSFNFGGKTMTTINLVNGTGLGTDTTGVIQLFSIFGTDIIDRGALGTASLSPMRYSVTGAAGSKIFKLELFNFGFADEKYTYNSLNDSANLQVWLYEGTNAIEVRFGDSKITNLSDYFFFGGPMIGYVKNMDMGQGEFDYSYLLKGSPTAPTIDSIAKGGMNFPSLSSYPPAGTVYKFIPKATTSVKDLLTEKINVFPTQCTDAIFIQNQEMPDTYYQVVSISGNVLRNGKLENGQTKIDVSNLTAGMYILRVDNVIGYDLRKFVKL